MIKLVAIAFALLSSATSPAWGQGAPTAAGGPSAAAMPMPGTAAPRGATSGMAMSGSGAQSGFTIDQKGVKRTASPTAAGAATRPPDTKSRTPGAVVTPGSPGTDGSGNKSFFESRSNTARSDGAVAGNTRESAPAAGSIVKN